jgi:hypothetical protein
MKNYDEGLTVKVRVSNRSELKSNVVGDVCVLRNWNIADALEPFDLLAAGRPSGKLLKQHRTL